MPTWNNLGDIFPSASHGDQISLIDLRQIDRPKVLTVREMRDAVSAIARGIAAFGLSKGDRIAILSENRAEFFQCYFAIMQAGLAAVPINFRLSREAVAHIFADADVRLVFVDEGRRGFVPPDFPTVLLDGEGQGSIEGMKAPGDFRPVIPTSGEVAKILYTSGSTGRPKGVPLSHGGQLWALGHSVQPTPEHPTERSLVVAPAYHKNGLFFATVALANLQTLVSLPRFEPRTYLQAIATHRCTVLSGIPTMFAMIARERDLISDVDLSCVRRVIIGSAPLTEALIEKVATIFPDATIMNSYGTTEAGPGVFGPHPDGMLRPPLSLGHPLPDIDWKLTEQEDSSEGVLVLKTPATMDGYLNLPDVTADRLQDGWYYTGDVMRRDENGFFYFLGRSDDMFVCGGENVFPGEVEKLLEKHPMIAQAAVVPVEDEIKGHIPVAFVVPHSPTFHDEQEIRTFALENGPAFSHPRVVIFKDNIPVAGTYKVDRRTLVDEAARALRARGRLPARQTVVAVEPHAQSREP